MAVTDGLTGVKNHKYLMDRLKQEINHAVRHNRSFSVFLLDIDQFKSVNDTYGHPQGDLILKAISRHFTESIRDYDIFGRYGGEEFMLILPDTELDQAFSLADRLRSLFCQMEFPEVDTSLRVSFSGGLVEWSGEDSSLLLQKVDKLLYSAKRSGRNNIRK
jgi:diguanylate cyclase (GGDEF)-like protein